MFNTSASNLEYEEIICRSVFLQLDKSESDETIQKVQ